MATQVKSADQEADQALVIYTTFGVQRVEIWALLSRPQFTVALPLRISWVAFLNEL